MNRKNLISFALFLLMSLPAFAQVVEPQVDSSSFYESLTAIPQYSHSDSVEFGLIPPDDVPEIVDTVVVPVVDERGFNAKDLKMQKRYVSPDKATFSTREFFSNFFGGASFDYVVPIGMPVLYGPLATIYVGKQFTRVSSARLAMTGGIFYNISNGDRQLKMGLSADYLMNVSSLVGGYDKYRLCEVSALAGIGYHSNRASNFPFRGIKGRIGANFNFHVLKSLDLFIEPRFEVYGEDPYKLPGSDIWRRYATAVSVSFGIAAKAVDHVKWPQKPGINWYAVAMGGPMFQNSKQVRSLGIGRMMGGGVTAGVGFHYLKWLDFRIMADYSTCGWSVDVDWKRKNNHYYGARFEGLFDVVSMITRRDDTRFCAGFFFGPEMGGMLKVSDINDVRPSGEKVVPDIKFAYFGATAGLQFGCRVMQNMKIILEPRASIVPYLSKSSGSGFYTYYYDMPLSVNLGIEYHFGGRRE